MPIPTLRTSRNAYPSLSDLTDLSRPVTILQDCVVVATVVNAERAFFVIAASSTHSVSYSLRYGGWFTRYATPAEVQVLSQREAQRERLERLIP
jgi:hypothetical protein